MWLFHAHYLSNGLGWTPEKIHEATGVSRSYVSTRIQCHEDIRPLHEDVNRLTLEESLYFQVLPLEVGKYFVDGGVVVPWVESWFGKDELPPDRVRGEGVGSG